MKVTGRPCDCLSFCANSRRLSDRRELAAGREEGREVEDRVDLEFRENAVEDRAVEDRARELAGDERGERRLERLEVQRDDRARAGRGEARDEAVADLAAGAGDEDDGFSHGPEC